jgi:hypothetical protein
MHYAFIAVSEDTPDSELIYIKRALHAELTIEGCHSIRFEGPRYFVASELPEGYASSEAKKSDPTYGLAAFGESRRDSIGNKVLRAEGTYSIPEPPPPRIVERGL